MIRMNILGYTIDKPGYRFTTSTDVIRGLDVGFVVYSIGEDSSDDGGQKRQKGQSQSWDLSFAVKR